MRILPGKIFDFPEKYGIVRVESEEEMECEEALKNLRDCVLANLTSYTKYGILLT